VAVMTLALLSVAGEILLRVMRDRSGSAERSVNQTQPRWAALVKAGFLEPNDDPERKYSLRAGSLMEQEGRIFRVSKHHTRGPDLSDPKPENERRLLCIGDSYAFGLWCAENETVVAKLVERANERETERGSGLVWHAINQGVPAYQSGQQLAAFESEGLGLEPDAVVIYFNTNDIIRFGYFLDERHGLYADNLPLLPVWLKRVSRSFSPVVSAFQSRPAAFAASRAPSKACSARGSAKCSSSRKSGGGGTCPSGVAAIRSTLS